MPKQLLKQYLAPEHDSFIFHEMMVHPVLFIHPKPQKIAIIDANTGILDEVLKHQGIQEVNCITNNANFPHINDQRVRQLSLDSPQWLAHDVESFDIIIQSDAPDNFLEEDFENYYRALKTDGIFIQSYPISLLQLHALEPVYEQLGLAGFNDWQLLNFPQPSYPSGWRIALMAAKGMLFNQISEKNIFNRGFKTRFYNYDMHKAALALPEFARQVEL